MNIRENLMDIATVFWRDWVVLKRRLAKFILSRMVAPMLYLVAFGWGLGRSIEVSSGTYLDFLVPGILALNSMNISFNSITPVHAERIYHKSLEEYTIAPIWPDAFLIGKVAAAVVRALISSAIIVVLAVLFGAHFQMTPLFLLVLVLNCVVFAEIGFLAAMKIRTYEEMAQVNTCRCPSSAAPSSRRRRCRRPCVISSSCCRSRTRAISCAASAAARMSRIFRCSCSSSTPWRGGSGGAAPSAG